MPWGQIGCEHLREIRTERHANDPPLNLQVRSPTLIRSPRRCSHARPI